MSPEEALESAALDQLDGSPYGPLLAGRIRRACTETLRRMKIRGSVQVLDGGRKVMVKIQEGPKVRSLHLSLQ